MTCPPLRNRAVPLKAPAARSANAGKPAPAIVTSTPVLSRAVGSSAAVHDLFFSPVDVRVLDEGEARDLFQKISKRSGQAEAERIFRITPPRKRQMAELQRCILLHGYIRYAQRGWPLVTIARHLERSFNKRGVADQLRNLLGKRPTKMQSTLLRSLIEEAKRLPIKRGRPKKNAAR